MFRQRLVRQSALSSSSSSDSSHDCPSTSPPSGIFHQLSAKSFNNLIHLSPEPGDNINGKRWHSVACDTFIIAEQKTPFNPVFNSDAKQMSEACPFLSSGSQPSLISNMAECTGKSDEDVLHDVLGTFSRGMDQKLATKCSININRRFSSDFPPPTYQEAIKLHKKFCTTSEADVFKQTLFKHEAIDSSSDDSQE